MSTTIDHTGSAELHLGLPARSGRLGAARGLVARWAAGTGAGPTAVADVVLGAGVALAVLGDEEPDRVSLSAARTDDGLVVSLTASGARRPGSDRGAVVRSLADTVEVERTPTGTTIRMSWRG